jgi:hypothetical protein
MNGYTGCWLEKGYYDDTELPQSTMYLSKKRRLGKSKVFNEISPKSQTVELKSAR